MGFETKNIHYPNVSRLPSSPANSESTRKPGEEKIQKGEFDQTLTQALQKTNLTDPTSTLNGAAVQNNDLNQAGQNLKFSAHALQRLQERKIVFDPEMLSRMRDAINKADSKGVQDTLVLTDKAALIVSVPNRTVITAMDRNSMSGNVFTNIDGAVII